MTNTLQSEIESIKTAFEKDIATDINTETLDSIKRIYLSRKEGRITRLFSLIPNLSVEEKRLYAPQINTLKNYIEQTLTDREKDHKGPAGSVYFDPTIPGNNISIGHLHPITQARIEAEDIFQKMGFSVIEPREIDDDYHVFETLNIPKGHPARDMWDTFWTNDNFIPITHTSSMQNRILTTQNPPIRAVVPGRCFRNEATDARHEHTFNQIEGVCVDTDITVSDLIGTLLTFLETYFQKKLRYKIQPSYFPFVEPGLEFLISCVICNGKGCQTCGQSGWLELVPGGMIHPHVLEMGNLDPEKYSGFAFGLGLDRLVMLRYAIEDIRLFHSGDLRFIRQF